MLENQTEEMIKKRLLDAVPSEIDKTEGSFIYDAVSPAAIELAEAYIEINSILDKVFVGSSYGEWLDKKAGEFGLSRKHATKATGEVLIKGKPQTVIPKGTIVQTEDDLQFRVTELVIIETEAVTAQVEALEEGIRYNIPTGRIVKFTTQPPGASSVFNEEPVSGGTEIEPDEEFSKRILIKARTPSTSGNANHYRQWAMEVSGIGNAKVFPLWDGPGTVKVSVIDMNKMPASDVLVEQVVNHIEDVRPVGALVSVFPASISTIDVLAMLAIVEGYSIDFIQQEFTNKFSSYLKEIAFTENIISHARIGYILLGIEGVKDYSSLTLNGEGDSIVLGSDAVPITGSINLKVKGV